MGKKKAKSSSGGSKKRNHQKPSRTMVSTNNWVDRLEFESLVVDEKTTTPSETTAAEADDDNVVAPTSVPEPQQQQHQQQPKEQETCSNDENDENDTNNSSNNSNKKDTFRIVSWNVLAEAYLRRHSHRNLPPSYQEVVFTPKRRRHVLKSVLTKLCFGSNSNHQPTDVLALQEVDLHKLVQTCLHQHGYEGISTPTVLAGGGAGGRVDACSIYWKKNLWELDRHQFVRLDDLATMLNHPEEEEEKEEDANNNKNHTNHTMNPGFQSSFLRRNMALLVRLRHRIHPHRRIVVANAHLFWNPSYEYVKLCQAHYILQQAKLFRGDDDDDPIVFCGDLNSQPSSRVHRYLTKGRINAQLCAPWYNQSNEEEEEEEDDDLFSGMTVSSTGAQKDEAIMTDAMQRLKLKKDCPDDEAPRIRYIMDYTLNRFTRWLRILGVDAALETEKEEIQRTKHGNILLFERCRRERRTLVTTSSKLLLRKGCPGGAYHISPIMAKNMEFSLVHMLLMHGVVLEPSNFLSRCVVCNGRIETVRDREAKRKIFAANHAPENLLDLECYACDGCGQGYWWCDRPTSSASRVKSQATKLFQVCLRGGVPIRGDLNMFSFVDVQAERKLPLDSKNTIKLQMPAVVDWLKDTELQCPIALKSAYALRSNDDNDDDKVLGETLAFSNVRSGFVGLLDYVFVESGRFRVTGRLRVPSSFRTLNERLEVPNGHLLPSDIWPSDHLAIGAELAFPTADDEEHNIGPLFCAPLGAAAAVPPPPRPPPTPHSPKCDCAGCLSCPSAPLGISDLRKTARLKKQREARLRNFYKSKT